MGACHSSPAGPKKTVVVVGGGYAGVHAAKALDRHAHVVLINAQEELQLFMASPRALVERGFAAKTFFPYAKLFKHGGRFLHGTATAIAPRAVTVARPDGTVEELACDYVLIATGAGVASPFAGGLAASSADARAALDGAQEAVAAAQRVVVVGGGPVGVESAAEIKCAYPSKEVTLIHSGPALASDSTAHLSPKAAAAYSAAVARKAGELGLRVLLNARAARPEGLKPGHALLAGPLTVATNTGAAVEADLLVWAIGAGAPHTSALQPHMAAALDEASGRVRVTRTLEVVGFPGVFAVGDAKLQVDAPKADPFMGFHAMLQAQHVAKSIRRAIQRGAPPAPYAPGPAVQIMTLGRHKGVASMFGWTVGEWVTSMKAGDMFTGNVRKEMNLAQ